MIQPRPAHSGLFLFECVSASKLTDDAPNPFLVDILLVLPNQSKVPGVSRHHSAQVIIYEQSKRRHLLRQCASGCVPFLSCPLLAHFHVTTNLLGTLCIHFTHLVVARATRIYIMFAWMHFWWPVSRSLPQMCLIPHCFISSSCLCPSALILCWNRVQME